VEPINDPNLKIEWFVNGVAIKTGHRFRTTHDFGYVALDVLYTYPDDSGTYMAKATNLLGEAVNTCQITVGGKIYMSLFCCTLEIYCSYLTLQPGHLNTAVGRVLW
jgi:hypothetical protein